MFKIFNHYNPENNYKNHCLSILYKSENTIFYADIKKLSLKQYKKFCQGEFEKYKMKILQMTVFAQVSNTFRRNITRIDRKYNRSEQGGRIS